jgi:hypothetical protein
VIGVGEADRRPAGALARVHHQQQDRKRLLRTLIADVTMLADPDRGAARIGICWRTAASDELRWHDRARPARLESHVCDAAQSLREALRAMTVVGCETPLPELLESAYEAVRSFNPRTSGRAMIAPEAYRILCQTIALAEVFLRPLRQLAKPLRPARAHSGAVAHPVGIPRAPRRPHLYRSGPRSTAARRTIASSTPANSPLACLASGLTR